MVDLKTTPAQDELSHLWAGGLGFLTSPQRSLPFHLVSWPLCPGGSGSLGLTLAHRHLFLTSPSTRRVVVPPLKPEAYLVPHSTPVSSPPPHP